MTKTEAREQLTKIATSFVAYQGDSVKIPAAEAIEQLVAKMEASPALIMRLYRGCGNDMVDQYDACYAAAVAYGAR